MKIMLKKGTQVSTSAISQEQLREEINNRTWRHTINLNGVVTKGQIDTERLLDQRALSPAIFRGRSVLDIGTWDGFYAFKAEEWGAASVVAIDIGKVVEDGGRNNFDFCKRVLNSSAEWMELDLYDLQPDVHGQFDVVLFMGVIYHLPAPLHALDVLSRIVRPNGLLVLESVVVNTSTEECFFVEKRGTLLKLWPTAQALRSSLSHYGFDIVKDDNEMLDPKKVKYRRFVLHAIRKSA